MKLGRWSTTAGNNNSTPPDGFPEGQAASTVNDGIREIMASIRTVFNDAAFFDQDFTPTFVSVSSFSVPGNQTSAIVAGRRLKLFDSTAFYATVTTASFTAVTTIHISADAGANNLTTSLSSFAISILSPQNPALPEQGVGVFNRLSVSATVVAAAVIAVNTEKAWVKFTGTAGGTSAQIVTSYNISSVSRSATGVYRVNFTNSFVDTDYSVNFWATGSSLSHIFLEGGTAATSSFKFTIRLLVVAGGSSSIVASDNSNSFGNNLSFHR